MWKKIKWQSVSAEKIKNENWMEFVEILTNLHYLELGKLHSEVM